MKRGMSFIIWPGPKPIPASLYDSIVGTIVGKGMPGARVIVSQIGPISHHGWYGRGSYDIFWIMVGQCYNGTTYKPKVWQWRFWINRDFLVEDNAINRILYPKPAIDRWMY